MPSQRPGHTSGDATVARVGRLGVVLILLVVGCSSIEFPTPTIMPTDSELATPPPVTTGPSPSQLIAHPSGPTDVVLRMSITGGLRYPGATVESPPTFTLYGDGRTIYTIERPGLHGSIVIELRQARLTEEQMAALVENALGRGGLTNARGRYEDVPIADDVTTNFEIHALGVDKTVAVYALGYSGDDVPDAPARAAFEMLAAGLRDFGDEVAAGNAEDLGVFEPEAYRVTLDQPFGPLEANREWPWDDLQPDDFEPDNSGFRLRVVTAEQAAAISDPPTSAPNDLVVVAPDGVEYLIRLRPLLPDEMQ